MAAANASPPGASSSTGASASPSSSEAPAPSLPPSSRSLSRANRPSASASSAPPPAPPPATCGVCGAARQARARVFPPRRQRRAAGAAPSAARCRPRRRRARRAAPGARASQTRSAATGSRRCRRATRARRRPRPAPAPPFRCQPRTAPTPPCHSSLRRWFSYKRVGARRQRARARRAHPVPAAACVHTTAAASRLGLGVADPLSCVHGRVTGARARAAAPGDGVQARLTRPRRAVPCRSPRGRWRRSCAPWCAAQRPLQRRWRKRRTRRGPGAPRCCHALQTLTPAPLSRCPRAAAARDSRDRRRLPGGHGRAPAADAEGGVAGRPGCARGCSCGGARRWAAPQAGGAARGGHAAIRGARAAAAARRRAAAGACGRAQPARGAGCNA
jgi:hypothetical protein